MLLELNNVEVIYSEVILVLKGINMEVAQNTIVALLGANGAGKTTTLKSISGLLRSEDGQVTSGSIHFNGKSIQNADPQEIVQMGLIQVMEGRRILEHMTVEQNLIVGGKPHKNRQELKNALERVYSYFPKLKNMRGRISGYLSGGEQQMLVIGRALMAKPQMMLLDEPSLGLAPIVVNEIFRVVEKINHEGMTILLVEQNVSQALSLSSRSFVLEEGRVALSGRGKDLLADPHVKKLYLGL